MGAIRKAVITAAGRGTRQYPASVTVQKELFPIVDTDGLCKPVLQVTVEQILASGIDEICIIANPVNRPIIEAHFTPISQQRMVDQFGGKQWAVDMNETIREMGSRISVIEQTDQLGFGHAVLQAKKWVGDSDFVLSIGDHVYSSPSSVTCFEQVINLADKHNCKVLSSLTRVPEQDIGRYGTIQAELLGDAGSLLGITKMAEKPSVDFARENLRSRSLPDGLYFCFFGIHVFPSTLFDHLQNIVDNDIRVRGEYQLTSAMEMLLADGNYRACEVEGITFDMGIPEGYLKTQIAIALQSPYRDAVIKAAANAQFQN